MNTRDAMKTDFSEYLNSQEITPPHDIERAVTARVRSDLSPSVTKVFIKILGVHSVVSLLSLSFCSQFGVQTLRVSDLMDFMMARFGHSLCHLICGGFYLGMSSLALALWLRPEDLRGLKRHPLLQVSLLILASLGVFVCIGEEVLALPTLFWIAGSYVSALVGIEVGWKLRSSGLN